MAWTYVPYPVLIADASGTVRHANPQATRLFPDLRSGSPLAGSVPSWLADGHLRWATAQFDEKAVLSGPVGERSFEAHPTAADDGDVVWWLVDDTDLRQAREELRVERERTAFLAQASHTLLSSLNLDRCMEVTGQLAAGHLADAALVVAPRSGSRLPVVTCLRGGAPRRSWWDTEPEAVPGLAEALQGFPPVPSQWIDPSSAPDWLVPEGFGPVGSIVVTPLPGHGVPAGALILLRRSAGAVFTEGEEVIARLFAARAGAALSAARLYAEQASLSQTLMQDLLPPVLHQIEGVDFAGGYRPSKDHERVGGDFYDVHPGKTEGDATLAVLGDVCGKGLEAAVLTGKIRNTLEALLPMADDHQQVIDLLNGALLNSHHTRFATLVMASAMREAGSVRLRVTSAGHPPALLVRRDGVVEETASRGTLIGVFPNAPATTTWETLAPGECCVLFTDGITEGKGGPLGGEMFGDERFRQALSQCAGMPAEVIVRHVQMLVGQWVGSGPHDDMAIVVIAAPRAHHLSAVGGHTRGRFTS
ncbi:PP2C family protein-serine/threonine phosphatase [Streptomyces goshikiensis]|uniref:PP2C family protein-serine/threonine phosphatase n=1 Tax=Streptomyces goshikiensis TaxID=1942 RepID=UPI002E12562E|nr:serine/threonine-protein phosphatase [Streptomyces goshikiensis]WSS02884.1 serine/threonine-protein phosphatase [Streptomyces goshikiensis]